MNYYEPTFGVLLIFVGIGLIMLASELTKPNDNSHFGPNKIGTAGICVIMMGISITYRAFTK